MPKLTLIAAPTFPAEVPIPIAGGDPISVSMTFKHRTKRELESFVKEREGKSDIDSFLDFVIGWELEDEFNRENIETLFEHHIGTPIVAFRTYLDQLYKAREKN